MAHPIAGVILTILIAALSRLLADEFKAWNPKMSSYIVRFAANMLPIRERLRFAEEWSAHINEVPGEIGKLCAAIGCVWASLMLWPSLERPQVDRKGRFKMPVEYRHLLEEQYGSQFFVTSLDGNVALIYPIKEWDRLEQKLAALSTFNPTKHKFWKCVNFWGQIVEMDDKGRLLIPPMLRQAARLRGDVDVLAYPVEDKAKGGLRRADRRLTYLEIRARVAPPSAGNGALFQRSSTIPSDH